jgi:hypothetical protein
LATLDITLHKSFPRTKLNWCQKTQHLLIIKFLWKYIAFKPLLNGFLDNKYFKLGQQICFKVII